MYQNANYRINKVRIVVYFNNNGRFECFIKNFNSCNILANIRISDHKLEIEIGRYKKVPREQRICKACKVLNDEKHFFPALSY